jgi:ABC-type transport system substrate-binding protein
MSNRSTSGRWENWVGRPARWWIGIGLCLAVAAAGCSSTPKSSPQGASQTKKGGTLTLEMNAQAANFDPASQTIFTSYVGPQMALVYGTLCNQNAQTGAVEMYMARSLTASAGGKVWTLVLHPGMKFSDGTAFNAAAVEYNIARLANPNSGSQEQQLAASLTMKVVNATTLTMSLSSPNTVFDSFFCQAFPFIASPTALQKEGANYGNHPVGAGPFELKSVDPGTSMTFVRNPEFSTFAPGQPYLDQVVVQEIPVLSQEIAQLQTGQAQAGAFLTSVGAIAKGLSGDGFTADETEFGGGGTLEFNDQTPPFNNIIAREAVSLALNRAALATSYSVGSPPATNLFAKSSPFYNAAYNLPASDPAKAQQLFNQYAAQTGHPLTFTMTEPDLSQPQIFASTLQSELQAYKNVSMKISTVPSSQYQTDVTTHSFQGTSYAVFIVNPVPAAIERFAAPSNGGISNYSDWNDPVVGSALTSIVNSSSQAEQAKQWAIIEQQYLKEDPFYLMNANIAGFFYKKNVLGGFTGVEYGDLPLWGQLYLLNP